MQRRSRAGGPRGDLTLVRDGAGDDARRPKTRWATTVDGVFIAYQDFGEGDHTIVVINRLYSHLGGLLGVASVRRFMNRLRSDLRVLHFDRRGTGLSDRSRAPTLEPRMDDVRAVMDAPASSEPRCSAGAVPAGAPGRPLRRHVPRTHVGSPPRRLAGRALGARLPLGHATEEWDDLHAVAIWGDDEHALRWGSSPAATGRRTARGTTRSSSSGHARCCATRRHREASRLFERDELETDVRPTRRRSTCRPLSSEEGNYAVDR